MKKLIPVILLSALLLTACSRSTESGESTPGTSAPAVSAETTAAEAQAGTQTTTAAGSTEHLLLYLEKNPIITINETARALDMSFNAASSAIRRLCEANILFQKGDAKRDRVFHYKEYLNVLRSGT